MFDKDKSFQAAVAAETKRAEDRAFAFRLVCDALAPQFMPDGVTTGLEGYYVGYYSPEQILEKELELGRQLVEKVKRLKPNLRTEVRRALEGTSYSRAAVQWLDSEFGMTLGRLRALRSTSGYNERGRRENEAFKSETYSRLSKLPEQLRRVQTVFTDGVAPLHVQYPLPDSATPKVLVPEGVSMEEMYIRSLGVFGLPVMQAYASRDVSLWSSSF